MRVPKTPTPNEKGEIADLISHAASHPIMAEDIQAMKEDEPERLERLIEAHTIGVSGIMVCVLFEIHDGFLFQRTRLLSERETQPAYDTCMDILPHLGMSADSRQWAASWAEVIDPSEHTLGSPRMAYNISQLVKPLGVTIQ